MKIEKNGKFIKVIADVGKNLYFNNSFCKVIYAPQLDTDSVTEYTDEECTEAGKVWYAPEGYHYVNKETQEDKGTLVVIIAGDDIRNYNLIPQEEINGGI